MVLDRPQQATAARASIECFFAQKWPHKELIIFNSTGHRLVDSCPWRYREIELRQRQPAQMLSLCFENSNGEWCLHWMPDCWYHSKYTEYHMAHRHKTHLTVLRNHRVFDLKNKRLVPSSDKTAVHWSFYRHFAVELESAVPLEKQFNVVDELDNPSGLVVQFAREIL